MIFKYRPAFLIAEMILLYIVAPVLLFGWGKRLSIFIALWVAGLYAIIRLRQLPDFSWHQLWHGQGWSQADYGKAVQRFLVLAALITALTLVMLPGRFLSFPLQRFSLWLLVMLLYPVLSIIPQEIFYRSFFFARYGEWEAVKRYGLLINGFMFGFSHIILHNWVAPCFCTIGGVLLAHSYSQHRSLKWVVCEHAWYGCWIFTIGLGWYFFTGNVHK